MITLDELDAIARRAAAELVADAPDPTETDAALAAVTSGTPTLRPTTRVTRHRARAGRAPVLMAAAAAAVIAIGIAGIIAVTRPESSPSGPAGVPVPTGAPVDPSAPATNLPATFAPQPGPFTITVTPGETSPREVLYAAATGSGDDELGDGCSDCDNARPHDPIISEAGAIVIFDAANRRWVVVGRGPVPIAASIEMFELQLGRDGLIYTSAKVGDSDTWSIVVWDPAQLDAPVTTMATEERGAALGLFAHERGVSYGGHTLEYLGPETTSLGDVKVGTGGATQTLVHTYPDGTGTTWILPRGWTAQLPAAGLGDGSVMVNVFTGEAMWLVRLFPDGTSRAMPPVQGDGVWAAPSYTLDGVSVVERTDDGFEIARYPLPQHPSAADPAVTPEPTTAPASPTPTTEPTATTYGGTGAPPGTPFAVTTTAGPLTTPEILYSASVGSAVDQLGYDACEECERSRPFDPVALDGFVVIVDWLNDRIVTVRGGIPSAWPLPAGFQAQATTLGYDSMLYVAGEYGVGTANRRAVVLRYLPGDAAVPLAELPIDGPFLGQLAALGDGIDVNGDQATDVPYAGDGVPPIHAWLEPHVAAATESPKVTVRSTTDMQITWTLPDGWQLGGWSRALDTYPDGVVSTLGPNGEHLLVRLGADGSSVAMPAPATVGQGFQPHLDARGIVVLEQTDDGFAVVRYPLPG